MRIADSPLKKRIAALGEVHLLPIGFLRTRPFTFERRVVGLAQGIEFQKGARSKAGNFTANVFWRYICNPANSEWGFGYCQRIGEFMSGSDIWFDFASTDGLDREFPFLAEAISGKVIPFFDKYRSVETIISCFESGECDERMFFGVDEGWRLCNLGYCYLFLGNKVKASKFLEDVVKKHSNDPYDWVRNRRNIVEQTLREIAGAT